MERNSPKGVISVSRVVIATVLAGTVLFGAVGIAIRQPVLATMDFEGDHRADPDRLRRDVETLTNLPLARCSGDSVALAAAAEYLTERFGSTGARVSYQDFSVRGDVFRNVIATVGPRNGKRLVVGAHYDAFCEPTALPGADDNASGVAGLIELAYLLSTARLEMRVDLVAFANEEPPFFASEFMGSQIHAEALSGSDVVGMLSLEMIGYFREDQSWPSWVLQILYPDDGHFVAVIGRWSDIPLTRDVKRAMLGAGTRTLSFTSPAGTGTDASDHRSYWQHGFPAVMVTDTAYVRNPNYHTIRDTPETLDYRRMATVVDGIYNAVLHAHEFSDN